LVKEPLEVQSVMAVGPAVAFCRIPHIWEKRWIESVLESLQETAVTCSLVQLQFVSWPKTAVLQRERWQAEYTRCVIRMLHSISGLIGRMAFLQNLRNTQQIPQFTIRATGTNTHKLPKKEPSSYRFLLCKYKSIGGSYL